MRCAPTTVWRPLGMLSAGIAHEMQNPLAAIVDNLEPGAEVVDGARRRRAAGDPESLQLVDELALDHERLRVASDSSSGWRSNLTSSAREGPVASVPVRPAGVGRQRASPAEEAPGSGGGRRLPAW